MPSTLVDIDVIKQFSLRRSAAPTQGEALCRKRKRPGRPGPRAQKEASGHRSFHRQAVSAGDMAPTGPGTNPQRPHGSQPIQTLTISKSSRLHAVSLEQ